MASAGSSCAQPGPVAGNIATTVSLAAGGTATFTVTATVDPNATGTLVNTASVAAPPGVTDSDPSNNSSTDTDALGPAADLAIVKDFGRFHYGHTWRPHRLHDRCLQRRASAVDQRGSDGSAFPPYCCPSSWTFAWHPPSGLLLRAHSSGPVAGNIATTVSLAAGGTATLTVTATVDPNATGTLVNTASVAAPPGVTDSNPANNSSTDSDTLGASADLSVVKTGTATVMPGGAVTYTIVVTNAGPSNVTGLTLTDSVPAALTNVQWTCTAQGTATCGAAAGSGNSIVLTGSSLNAGPGNSLTVTVTATAGSAGSFQNTATVAGPPGVTDPNPGNDSSSTTTVVGALAAAIPTLSPRALVALAVLLAAIALRQLRPQA